MSPPDARVYPLTKNKKSSNSGVEDRLIELLAECTHDPLRFVLVAFPWGEAGTPLASETGPDAWQSELLGQVRDGLLTPAGAIQIATASGHGVGKGHCYQTLIETPIGQRRWGDLRVGDLVFGEDGVPTQVRALHPYPVRACYRVTFDDGSFAEVSAEHLWNVRGRQERRNNRPGWRTLSTEELLKLGVKRPNGVAQARQWEIPIQGAAQFEDREIDLHPWVMGAWLGDGSKGQPRISKPYPEIAQKLRDLGYEISTSTDGMTHTLLGLGDVFSGGVFERGSHERYIPDDYKFNTVENRRALLEGLLDTDGEIGKDNHSIGYSTTSLKLAEDVIWLARSLGCKAKMQPAIKHGWYPDEGGDRVECRDCYRVTLSMPWNPFTLAHRKERYRAAEARYLTRWIESIERIADADGMCITVDREGGLYLANDFIVTHNSGLVAWLILWSLSTFPDTHGVVTANTEIQLRTKTWPELAKWYQLFIAKHWFHFTATAIYSADPEHEKTWRVDAIAWSERNTEAFAGLHNQGKRIVVIFDEASSIPEVIWETTEGALTDKDTEIMWFVFGNPTRNTGRFRECWGRYRHRWLPHQVDSRSAKMTDKTQIARWVADYGEDSDFVRVRVRGVFPRAGSMQFISGELVDAACSQVRDVAASRYDQLVMGVDVARYGDDQTVIVLRRGRDARGIPWIKMRGEDTMTVAAKVAELAQEYRPDAIFIDGGGVGAGVVDRLRMLHFPVIEVQFGGKADYSGPTQEGAFVYANKRAEMWGMMRDWLRGGAIPDDPELKADLVGVEYGYVLRNGKDAIQLESKADMKRRGLASPDLSDSLALTFAYPIGTSDHSQGLRKAPVHQSEYSPFAEAFKVGQAGGGPSRGRSEGWWPGKQ